jgi:hypothetical protein
MINPMLSQDDIARMSREEKLRILEAIWTDLSKDDASVESPEWHAKALRDTERRVASGEEASVSWEDAKRMLRSPAE